MANGSSESRQAGRASVLLFAVLEHDGSLIPVKVGNISASGALVIGNRLPAGGSNVTFRRQELSVGGRVAWRDLDHAGIEFDQTFELEDLLRKSGLKDMVQPPMPLPRPRERDG